MNPSQLVCLCNSRQAAFVCSQGIIVALHQKVHGTVQRPCRPGQLNLPGGGKVLEGICSSRRSVCRQAVQHCKGCHRACALQQAVTAPNSCPPCWCLDGLGLCSQAAENRC